MRLGCAEFLVEVSSTSSEHLTVHLVQLSAAQRYSALLSAGSAAQLSAARRISAHLSASQRSSSSSAQLTRSSGACSSVPLGAAVLRSLAQLCAA